MVFQNFERKLWKTHIFIKILHHCLNMIPIEEQLGLNFSFARKYILQIGEMRQKNQNLKFQQFFPKKKKFCNFFQKFKFFSKFQ